MTSEDAPQRTEAGAVPATSATDWQMAGLQHEIFLRVLPAVRHDMLGPVSVARMDVAILKRKLAADEPDIAACRDKLLTLDGHLSGVSQGLGLLRRWDTARGDTARAGETLAFAVGLMTPLLRLREITLAPLPDVLPPELDDVQRPQSAFLYACLAVLCHVQDHLPPGSRVSMALTPEGVSMSHGVQDAGTRPASVATTPAAPVSARRIDRAGAEALIGALGYRATWTADGCTVAAVQG